MLVGSHNHHCELCGFDSTSYTVAPCLREDLPARRQDGATRRQSVASGRVAGTCDGLCLPRLRAILEHPTDRNVARRAGAKADSFFALDHDDGPARRSSCCATDFARARYDDSKETSPFPTILPPCHRSRRARYVAAEQTWWTRWTPDAARQTLGAGDAARTTAAWLEELPAAAAAWPRACCRRIRQDRAHGALSWSRSDPWRSA